jgi:hypothetical protein
MLLTLATLAGCQPPATPAQPPAASSEFKTADDLLNALETADQGLQSLTADVKYDRTFEIQGDRQIHLGRLWFVSDPPKSAGDPPQRKFAIHFDRVFIGPVQRTQDKTYIFDGQWMMEKDGESKFFQKKQVVGPGEHFDPLKVGEGPFVLPIGQRKGDILKRFNVELLPSGAGLDAAKDATEEDKQAAESAKGDVEGAYQLKLTPRDGAKDDDFSEVRLWYKRGKQGELLPRMARTVNPAGDVSLVLLINVEVQLAGKPENAAAKVPPETLDTTPPPGWDGTTQAWRKSADADRREGPDAGDK